MTTHQGGCHCGAVRFEVEAPATITVKACNCSICNMSGYLHLIVPNSQFRLLQGEAELSDYQFNTGTAHHYFCKSCGIKSFYIPRSHPDGVSVNARCIDSDAVADMQIRHINGRDWEQAYPAGRGEFD